MNNKIKPKFLGIGSAFNTELGDTSCYFIIGNTLFLIDCGSDVFAKIKKVIDDNNIEKVNVMITHTHSDHYGSLSTLVEYLYYVKKIKPQIIGECNLLKLIIELLDCNLVSSDMVCLYELYGDNDECKLSVGDYKIIVSSYSIPHAINDGIYSCAYSVSISNNEYKDMYMFVWDCCNVTASTIVNLDKAIETHDNAYLFHDTCIANYPHNVHTYYEKLIDEFGEYDKEKIYFVHLDDKKLLDISKENGFGNIKDFM